MTMLRDERGQWSAARTLLLAWLLHCVTLIWLRLPQLTPMIMTFHAGIATALITWSAGPRIAQYISPIGTSLVQALPKAAWRKERDVEVGIDPTKE